MKIFYPNLNIRNVRCDGKDKTKEQCSCICNGSLQKRIVGQSDAETT